MTQTIDEQKETYYKFILEKANEIYHLWKKTAISSKKLVKKAHELVFDKRLKKDALYRFYAIAFTHALEMRVNKRYGTFFRRLFLFFAFIRERSVLKILKNIFGFYSCDDVRETLGVELEKIIKLLSQRRDKQTIGGGKRSNLVDITIEEELDVFFDECIKVDAQKVWENNLDIGKIGKEDTQDKLFVSNTKADHREKIFVNENEGIKQEVENKNTDKTITKLSKHDEKTIKISNDITLEKTQKNNGERKTVVKEHISLEKNFLIEEREKESPSPFPVFNKNAENKFILTSKDDTVVKVKNEVKLESKNGESVDKNIQAETISKTPFPVFRETKLGVTNVPEKVVDKGIKEVKSEKTVKNVNEVNYFKEKSPQIKTNIPNISEENKTRIALNITMSKMEILALTEQLKMAANKEAKMVEQEWREKISISNSENKIKQSEKGVVKSSKQGIRAPGTKK